jgi:L-Ala-D/L-Glu epimerase
MALSMALAAQRFELREPFTITRYSITAIEPLWVTLSDGEHRGRGEGMIVDYHGETVASLIEQLEALRGAIESGAPVDAVVAELPFGAARCALDNAYFDLECKRSGQRAWQRLGLPEPAGLETQYTISLGEPDDMAAAARRHARYPRLKVKLGRGRGDEHRLDAVRQARPDAVLIVDANQGWGDGDLERLLPHCVAAAVKLIEQPLKIGQDGALASLHSPIPLCADESIDALDSLARLPPGYAAINIKLDKTGGLREGYRLALAARARGYRLMIGCMLGSSLGMAAAQVLGPLADFIDLDGPLDLVADCADAIDYDIARMGVPSAALWG